MDEQARKIMYVIGGPGTGKSTLAARLFPGSDGVTVRGAVSYVQYPGGRCLGFVRDTTSGTDALPMAVLPKVEDLLREEPGLYFGEGDRLACGRFFGRAMAMGYEVTVVTLVAAGVVTEMRRRERGSNHTSTWVKSRMTKVKNLYTSWGKPQWLFSTTAGVEDAVAALELHPVVKGILGRPE